MTSVYAHVDRKVDEVLQRIANGEAVIVRGKRVLYAKKVPGGRRYRILVVYEDGAQEAFLPSKFLETVWKT